MKKNILLFGFILLSFILKAQTDGISYQAVIIDNNPQEIPGVDIPSNNLPNASLKVQFSIIDDSGSTEYQEEHNTSTDPYGMINLMVGHGNALIGAFNEIYWDNDKFLKVEIDLFDGNGLVEFSYQELTYIPYVRHREIIATSTLDVDGVTNLNNSFYVNNASPSELSGSLTVDGVTNLNNSFNVNNASPSQLTGDLTVDGITNLNSNFNVNNASPSYLTGNLTVDGSTNLNSPLNVNNQATTTLTGDLFVLGTANFTDGIFDNITVNLHSSLNTLTAVGLTNINNTFNVNNASVSNLSGDLNVDGITNLNADFNVNNQSASHLTGTLLVDDKSDFNGPVTINAQAVTLAQANYSAYPLQVEGSQQGIAIKITPNNPNRNNNYLAFWDGDDTIRGRIEASNGLVTISTNIIWDLIGIPDFGDIIGADPGDTPPDVTANQYFNNDYAFGAYSLTVDLINSIIRFGINATAAAGACVVGDCDDAVWSFVDIVVDGIQLGGYITYNEINIGVAFESGGADYAEWLQKANTNEVLTFGDVVGVKGGLVSKSFTDANKFMVVSQNPMVSGAMPEESETYKYEKIAFLGQVPVKVLGNAKIGDYIIPSQNGDGYAIAIAPDNMKINDYKNIIGVAWSEANEQGLFSYVQTAIGINTNDMANQVEQMQAVMNMMQASLAKLDKDYQITHFDVANIKPKQNITEVYTLKQRVADQSKALEYNNLKDAMQSAITMLDKDAKFDILKMPYMKEMVDNPTKETTKKMLEHYKKVLIKLQKLRPINR